MFRSLFILLVFSFVSLAANAQSAVSCPKDNKNKEKHHFHFSLKHLFHPDPQRKANKAKEKATKKEIKQQKKDVKNYQKKHNRGKSVTSGKSAYKTTIKENKRRSKRVNKNKPADPWIVRIFKHKK